MVVLVSHGCQKENLTPNNLIDCTSLDCVTGNNQLITNKNPSGLDLSNLPAIQRDYVATTPSKIVNTYHNLFGYPAWELTSGFKNIDGRFDQLFVPLFKEDDAQVNAIIMHTTMHDSGKTYLKFIPRSFVKNYPLEKHIKRTEEGKLLNLSREFIVSAFTGIEQELFDVVHHDLYASLPQLNTSEVDFRDCIVVTRYLITQCWAIFAGSTFRGIECSESYETETTGCSGTNGTGTRPTGTGSWTGGFTGGGGGNGTTNNSSGDTSIDRDPCSEDGRQCPPEDDQGTDIEDIIITLINGSNTTNNIDPLHYPCIFDVVDQALQNGANQLNQAIQQLLGVDVNMNLVVSTNHVTLGDDTNGQTNSSVDGPSGLFTSNITINPRLEGCTKDRIYATMYHELIHAYLTTLWQYALDDAYDFSISDFINQYPTFVSFDIPTNELTINQHEIMSEQFITSMMFHLELFNPALRREHTRHMVLSGLTETSYWNNILSEEERQEAVETIDQSRCSNGITAPRPSYNFIRCD